MTRQPYPSDLTDEQWELINDLIPPAKPGGRPREVSMREVLNAIMYVLRSGCAWRLVPVVSKYRIALGAVPRDGVSHGGSVHFQRRLGIRRAFGHRGADNGLESERVTLRCGSSSEAAHRDVVGIRSTLRSHPLPRRDRSGDYRDPDDSARDDSVSETR